MRERHRGLKKLSPLCTASEVKFYWTAASRGATHGGRGKALVTCGRHVSYKSPTFVKLLVFFTKKRSCTQNKFRVLTLCAWTRKKKCSHFHILSNFNSPPHFIGSFCFVVHIVYVGTDARKNLLLLKLASKAFRWLIIKKECVHYCIITRSHPLLHYY